MKGLDRALSSIRQLLNKAEEALAEAAREGAEETLLLARRNAPVRTGRLRNSLAFHSSGLQSRVETECPYAKHVELGGLHSPAHPFLLPAAMESDYPARAVRAIKERLK